MAYETPLAPEPVQAPARRWPLAGAMALDVVIALLAFVGLSLIIQVGFVLVRGAMLPGGLAALRGQSPSDVVRLIGADGLFFSLLATNLAFVAIPLLRLRLRREPLATLGLRAERPLRLVLFGLGLGVLILIGNAALGLFFQSLGIRQNQAQQYPLVAGDYLGQILFLIGAAVLAPIGEEVLFRGYIFNALRQTFANRPWGLPVAYIVSALVFSLVHVATATEGLIGLLVPVFVMGLALAWAMHRTGSVLPGIIAHSVNNGVALLALLTCVNTPGLCPTV